jgi:bifunctional non-homologous end joining protein LigD
MSEMHFGKYSVEITNADKVFFPEGKLTKGDLIEYYLEAASVILPHLADRLIVMHRFPDGIDGEGFYHKDVPDYFPNWIDRQTVKKEGGSITHILCSNAATLAYIANQGCITPHTWLSRRDRIDYPDQLIFDLDPPGEEAPTGEGFGEVRRTALALKELLEDLGLRAFVKTTGSRGLHVMTVLDRSANFDEVRAFARGVARLLVDRNPDRLTVEQRKAQRWDRIFIDVARNAYAQTAAPAYAVRPKPHAPVSTPLDWSELNDTKLDSQTYNLENIRRRFGQKQDPWAAIYRHGHSLKEPQQRLEAMLAAGSAKPA